MKILSRLGMLAGLLVIISTPSWAIIEPRPFATDHRIRTMVYSPDDVFVFTGHYGYQSSIIFGEGEEIETISVGDSLAWQMNPSGNRLFLKPMEQDATTNMTLITNKRTYMFELHAEEAADIRDERLTFAMRFLYPDENTGYVSDYHSGQELPNIEDEPHKYNFNYSMTGPEHIAPIRIFDDGEFTFFQFRNKNADIPAFFLVAADGSEEIINYRVQGPYIVVERVTAQFTLRHGSDYVCVYNETMPLRGRKEKPRGT